MSNDILFIADKHNSKFNAEPLFLLEDQHDNDAQGIPDKIRYNTGYFWCRGDHNLSDSQQYSQSYKQFFDTKYSVVHRQVTISDLVMEQERPGGYCVQHFNLHFHGATESVSRDLRRDFTRWLRDHRESGSYFRDHCTLISLYEKSSNETETSLGLVDMYCKVKYEYNYHHLSYEKKISDSSIREYETPNFYALSLSHVGPTQRVIASLFGMIPIPDDSEKFLPTNTYFNKWALHYDDYKDAAPAPLLSHYVSMFFSKNSISKVNESFKYRELFPMYSTIEFTTDTNCEMGSILEETNFAPILKHQITHRLNSVLKETSEIRVDMSESESYISTEHIDSVYRKYWDINNFFKEWEFEEMQSSAYFDSDVVLTEENRAYYNLMALIVQGKIQKIKKDKYRKFSDILAGKLAYSEPVIYIVEKRGAEGNLLQTFNFTNTDKTEIIKFVDSQVKYNSKYEYSLKCLSIVVGTKYRYGDMNLNLMTEIGFYVEMEPDILLMEADLMKNSVWIMDNPPVNPDAEIIPIVGENDKVRIHLRSPTGRFKKKPIIFSESENEMIEKIREAQDIPDDVEEITFESDDNIDRFVMYRTDFLPTNHMQFEIHGKRKEISTADDFITGITGRDTRGVAASLIDDISPNKKYYYCFRSIDIHGHHSYPSEIYKVEIVDDHGSIYPIIEVCEIKKPDTRQVTKSFKRFMYVSPALRNLVPNDDAMNIDWSDEGGGPSLGHQVVLGVGDEATWGQQFKIRLKSKTTARVLDFNFKFNHEHKLNSVDED